jgi:peptidoglycan hydrolase-like protein with peptidoglycan-binding domain
VSRKPVRKGIEATSAGDGPMADLVDLVFDNPARSGGLMVMALTATAIISNAMFLQNSHRPDPLFGPRPAVARTPAAPAPVALVPMPTPSPLHVSQPAAVSVPIPPLPRAAPIAAVPTPLAPAAPTAALITDIQRELARLGLYGGAIDGRTGSRTGAAISHYEAAAGRPITGKPRAELLQAMKQPLPPPQTTVAAPVADPIAAELNQREQQRAASIAAAQKSTAASRIQANYRIVQGALNRIGYGPVPVDGAAGQETVDAIRRFELDNGLPVSGEPSDVLIARLIAIGALKAT